MIYYLYEWFKENGIRFPGSSLMGFQTFRIMMSILSALIITLVYGKKLINVLRRRLIGETVRPLGLAGENAKQGTPTMGGIIIILGILVPTLLFANLTSIYIILMIICTLWLGAVGFLDDYLKLRAKKLSQNENGYIKKDKDGLAGWFKILGQVGLGILVGLILCFNSDVKIWRDYFGEVKPDNPAIITRVINGHQKKFIETKHPVTTVPFIKNHEFNYSILLPDSLKDYTWVLYILIVTVTIVAVSNSSNITDGLDGLATGTSAVIGTMLGIFAYTSGNFVFADYLNIMYIPNLGELSIFIAAMIGACVGFLWYNSFPAQVFMGDTGSLTLGGLIATIAIIVHKELLLPIFCGIFFVESLSVIIQVSYFKYTKKISGVGRRVFLMSPLHHHYQKKGYHEAQIVIRFWIIQIFLVTICILTLKMR